MRDGSKVTTRKEWEEKRRPELKALFQHYMYGMLPPRPSTVEFTIRGTYPDFLDGAATLKLVTISFGSDDIAPRIDLMVVTPNGKREAVPLFLSMNFCGNHALTADRRIPLARGWLYNSCKGCTNNLATEAARGGQAGDWPLEEIVRRGYGFASFCSSDVDSDQADISEGVYRWLSTKAGSGFASSAHSRGSIAAWAWGFHRSMDYLVTDAAVDPRRIAAVGHSRNGKTALLAAAFDERIALAIPCQAGSGGTGPSRVSKRLAAPQVNGRPTAETIAVINRNFPHWFNAEFKKFNDQPERLPFDQHLLIALCAPRPVLLSNAVDDQWANPEGQFELLLAAEPAYRLTGGGAVGVREMPAPGRLVDSRLGYFIRAGKHSMGPADWSAFLDYADRHLR